MIAKAFIATLLLAQALFGESAVNLTKGQAIEKARLVTLKFCTNHAEGAFDSFRVRCEFYAQPVADGWEVAVHPMYEDKEGRQVVSEDGGILLRYSKTGQLLGHEGQDY